MNTNCPPYPAVVPVRTPTAVVGTPVVGVPSSCAAPSSDIGGTLAGTVLSATILAALLAAVINVVLARRKSREEERARLRDRFAQAYAAYADYCEFAYAVRRRRHDDPPAERVRISEALRRVQSDLSAHEAWVRLESESVGMAYTKLIQEMRRVAGGAMRQAWADAPATSDPDVNIPPTTVDLSSLRPFEKAYVDAVAAHLRALTPWWSK